VPESAKTRSKTLETTDGTNTDHRIESTNLVQHEAGVTNRKRRSTLVGSSAAGFFRQVAWSSLEVQNDSHDIRVTALKRGGED
jgi:hypothetical protein